MTPFGPGSLPLALDSDSMSGLLVAIGDQQRAIEFTLGTAGAREVVELIATTSVSRPLG